MVEVFKTNITNKTDAANILGDIHQKFPSYSANFDLQDCDRILRVKCTSDKIKATLVIRIVLHFGYHAEILTEANADAVIDYPDGLMNQR